MSWQCYYCKSQLTLEMQQKNHLCPNCRSDMHCCNNCTHYNETIATKCHEPNSPWVGNKQANNECPYFEFKIHTVRLHNENLVMQSEAEKAKEAFRALFRN